MCELSTDVTAHRGQRGEESVLLGHPALQTSVVRPSWDSEPLTSFRDRHLLASEHDPVVRPGVVVLLDGGFPPDVGRFVVPVIVDSTKRVSGTKDSAFRSRTDVLEEVLEGVEPPHTHPYPTSAVVGVLGVRWVEAPMLHLSPRLVLGAGGPGPGVSVLLAGQPAGSPHLSSETSARLRPSVHHDVLVDLPRWRAAVAGDPDIASRRNAFQHRPPSISHGPEDSTN